MKIFIVDRTLERWQREWDEALLADAAPDPALLPVIVGADSALVRPGFPTFIPDFARRGWELRLAPALRVGRLGKWIEPRFAHRYFDAVALAGLLRPADHSAPWLPIFDGAISPGVFQPIDFSRRACGQCALTTSATSEPLAFDAASLRGAEILALISRSTTIKSGDIIVPAMFPAAIEAEIDTTLRAALSLPGGAEGAPGLEARLK